MDFRGFHYRQILVLYGIGRESSNDRITIIAVRLRGNKKVQNLSSMWYKKLPQQLATQGDFGLEPSYYTLLSTAIPDTGTCF